MKSNMSQGDKIIRILVGVSIGIAGLFLSQLWFGVIALIILATALMNFDPFYALFGFSTRKYHKSPFEAKRKKKNHH